MNKDIDNIFSDKIGEEITKEIKVKRRKYNSKLILKTISLTLAILVVISLALNIISDKFIKYSFHKQSSNLYEEYTVMHPNQYIGGKRYLEAGLFKSINLYDIGAILEGKVFHGGTMTLVGGLKFGNVGSIYIDYNDYYIDEEITNRPFNTNGLRQLNFMLPYINYDKTINDFAYLNEIIDNKYVEMVISFDREYSYEEVNKNFNSSDISFYWVDSATSKEKEYYIENKVYLNEKQVIGIKSITSNGKSIADEGERVSNFKETISYLKGTEYKKVISNIDENSFNISGIVIQGTVEQLKKYENNPMIKHAIIGNVVDKF